MNNNMYAAQSRQRAMMPTTVQTGIIQRPMDQQFPMSHNPTNLHNMINNNTVRVIAQNGQNPAMPIYQLDNNGNQRLQGPMVQIQLQQIQNQQMQNQQMQNQQMQNQQIQNQQMQSQHIQAQHNQSLNGQGHQTQGQQRTIYGQQTQGQQALGTQRTNQQIPDQQISIPQMTTNAYKYPQIPVKQMPFQQSPVQQSPVQQSPVQHTPVQHTPVQQSPVQHTLVQHLTSTQTPNSGRPIYRLVNNSQPVMNTLSQQTVLQTSQSNNITPAKSNSQMSTVNNNSVATNQTPQSVATKISEEEATKVEEQLTILAERYLKNLKATLENRECIVDEKDVKIFSTLKTVLEDPKSQTKKVTLKHVEKIKEFCKKAEVLLHDYKQKKVKPIAFPTSEELFGKRIIADRNCTTPVTDDTSSFSLDPFGPTNSVNKSLDSAFDDVLHQLNKKDPKLMKRVQKNLVKFVRNQCKNQIHYMPKLLQKQEENGSDNEGNKMETNFDEHEFDFIDKVVIEGFEDRSSKDRNPALDQYGLLRTDIDFNFLSSLDFVDVQCEIDLISGEFNILRMDEQIYSADWCTRDNDWEEQASFLAVTYKSDSFTTQIPALWLRVPTDYKQSGSIDWNLNLESYATDSQLCLDDVRTAVKDEFSDLATQYHLSGVSLLMALSVFKRSIETGHSNYQCRKALS